MYDGRFEVADGQVRFYEENGFVHLQDVLTPEEVATLRHALDRAAEEVRQKQLQTLGTQELTRDTPRSFCRWSMSGSATPPSKSTC